MLRSLRRSHSAWYNSRGNGREALFGMTAAAAKGAHKELTPFRNDLNHFAIWSPDLDSDSSSSSISISRALVKKTIPIPAGHSAR